MRVWHQSTTLQVRNVEDNADKSIKDPMGHPLPPCIVMERGESLDIWAERAKPDRAVAFAVRPHWQHSLSISSAIGEIGCDVLCHLAIFL